MEYRVGHKRERMGHDRERMEYLVQVKGGVHDRVEV